MFIDMNTETWKRLNWYHNMGLLETRAFTIGLEYIYRYKICNLM